MQVGEEKVFVPYYCYCCGMLWIMRDGRACECCPRCGGFWINKGSEG